MIGTAAGLLVVQVQLQPAPRLPLADCTAAVAVIGLLRLKAGCCVALVSQTKQVRWASGTGRS